uniref:Uncharacterized protein n=1 Tax=Panagrolaimus sp. ES5 TaxID=591445 RepID=A0AC34FC40_9BILA
MADPFGMPKLSGLSNLPPPSTTYSPSKRPQHRHRVFPPHESYSLEEKLKARRKEQRERQRHLEAVLAEAATKGSSDSSLLNEHFTRFVDDSNSKVNINLGKEKEFNKTGVKIGSTLSTSPGPLPLPAPTQSTVKVINSDENLKSGKEDSGG